MAKMNAKHQQYGKLTIAGKPGNELTYTCIHQRIINEEPEIEKLCMLAAPPNGSLPPPGQEHRLLKMGMVYARCIKAAYSIVN